MPTVIPRGFMHVIQPMRNVAAAKDWSVTYGVDVDGTPNTPQGALNLVDTAFRTSWAAGIDSSISILPAVGYYRDSGGLLQLFTSTVAAQPGGAANRNSPPPNVATVVRKRTLFVGKEFRGRCYFPGLLDETNVDENGIITPAGVTAIQTRATGWLTGVNNSGAGMYLFHGKDLTPPTQVTTLVVQPIVRTQRKRLPRG